jgi:CopA family copper-resistance protein
MISRRHLIAAAASGGLGAGLLARLPAWALSAAEGNLGLPTLTGDTFDLTVDRFRVQIAGRSGAGVGVNGSLPGPLLRMKEGDHVTLRVHNRLREDTSIHWHGFLLPFHMDGVPGVSFPGIRPGETFTYSFQLKQSGAYWYHSHSGLQEQLGHYGPIIIDPKGVDPVTYDRDYVMMLSDWSFEDPHRIFAKLKADGHVYNRQQRTLGDFFADAEREGLGPALADRAMWGEMRMSPRDISDVTGATYTYLVNGRSTRDNWNGLFSPGERVRLRIINGSAMTIFNVRIPGLSMTVVAADGLPVQPVETDEFQIGTAETYDVVVTPREARAFAFVAEAIDRSGQVVATLGPQPGMRAEEPALRPVPTLTMRDMGMDHGAMTHGAMTHGAMIHVAAGEGAAGHAHGDAARDVHVGHQPQPQPAGHALHAHGGSRAPGPDADPEAAASRPLRRGPGIDNLVATPLNRLDEPGTGLEGLSHRVMRYSQLRSLYPNPDQRPPGRQLDIHLTGNMERFMWSFDGVKFSDVSEALTLTEGERVRLRLVNDTMMNHPIHLHGMFFELANGGGAYQPRKHTVIVKPAEALSVDLTADAVGDWAFHCHLLYHMHAGMMQVVSVRPDTMKAGREEEGRHHDGMMRDQGHDHGMDHTGAGHEGLVREPAAPTPHSGHAGHAPAVSADPPHAGHGEHQ